MRLLHFTFLSLGLTFILYATVSYIKDIYVKHESNSTEPKIKLESEDTDIKTATPIEIETSIYSKKYTESEENALINFLKEYGHTPPIRDAFYRYSQTSIN